PGGTSWLIHRARCWRHWCIIPWSRTPRDWIAGPARSNIHNPTGEMVSNTQVLSFHCGAGSNDFVPASTATAHLTILGGGPAGLAAGHFARKAGLPFILFEAADRTGGNAVTFQEGPFRFDSGAHRFHDRDPTMTEEVQHLIGRDLLECEIPSVIFDNGRWVSFPLRPANLFGAIGPLAFARAAASLLRARLFTTRTDDDFEALACHTYGRDIATRYLLGYSEKLW